MNELILIKASAREYPSRSLRKKDGSRKSMPSHKAIPALVMVLALTLIVGKIARETSHVVSASGNAAQTSSSTFTSSSISIAFDLPTAAVVTFVLILLGLAASLLLMTRLSHTDHSAM